MMPASKAGSQDAPFHCGWNEEWRWDQDGDGLVDKIYHTITDQDCRYDENHDGVVNAADKHYDVNGDGINDVTYHDGGSDGYLDAMAHTYLYAANQVTICNIKRDYETTVEVSKNCKPAQTPYADPVMVPGHLP